MEKKKRTFYKLGAHASIFSDHTNGLKITRNVPGSTEKPESKATTTARQNGHIVEITEEEANRMFAALTPEERKCAYDEQGITEEATAASKGKEDEDEGGEEDQERTALLERLKAIKMPKSKREEIKALPNEELKAFIEAEEKQ